MTFARLTTVPTRDSSTVNNIEQMQETFWRWKPLEFTERSHSAIEKNCQANFIQISSMPTQPKSLHCHHNWAPWRRPSHLQCCNVRVWEIRQRSFHVRSFSILFCFPVWARRDDVIKGEQWFNDLELVYIQNLSSWQKRPPTCTKHQKYCPQNDIKSI